MKEIKETRYELITGYRYERTKIYGLKEIEAVIDVYDLWGGEQYEIEPGCLGLGRTLLTGLDKSLLITETYINEWSSGHKIAYVTNDEAMELIDDMYDRLEKEEEEENDW